MGVNIPGEMSLTKTMQFIGRAQIQNTPGGLYSRAATRLMGGRYARKSMMDAQQMKEIIQATMDQKEALP